MIDVDHQDARARAEQEGEIGDAVQVRVQRSAIKELRQWVQRCLFANLLQLFAQLADLLAELAEHAFLALGTLGHDLLHDRYDALGLVANRSRIVGLKCTDQFAELRSHALVRGAIFANRGRQTACEGMHGLTQVAQAAPDELSLVQTLRGEITTDAGEVAFEDFGARAVLALAALATAHGDALRPAFTLRASLLRRNVVSVERVVAE